MKIMGISQELRLEKASTDYILDINIVDLLLLTGKLHANACRYSKNHGRLQSDNLRMVQSKNKCTQYFQDLGDIEEHTLDMAKPCFCNEGMLVGPKFSVNFSASNLRFQLML